MNVEGLTQMERAVLGSALRFWANFAFPLYEKEYANAEPASPQDAQVLAVSAEVVETAKALLLELGERA